MAIRNLAFLRNVPKFGQRLVEAFDDVQSMLNNVSQQTNSSLQGQQQAPPSAPDSISVVAGGGVAHVQFTDSSSFYQGKNYHVMISTNPAFSNPITIHAGPSRDIRIPVGSQPLYYGGFADYPTSPASTVVYHGGSTPIAVTASGVDQPPIPSGQGSGTGFPSQISGYGPVPFRGNTPPKRAS